MYQIKDLKLQYILVCTMNITVPEINAMLSVPFLF